MKDKSELSPEMEKIFNYKPRWFVRYGLFLISFSLVCILWSCLFYVKHENVIIYQGSFDLSSSNTQTKLRIVISDIEAMQTKSLVSGTSCLIRFTSYPPDHEQTIRAVIDSLSFNKLKHACEVSFFPDQPFSASSVGNAASAQIEITGGKRRMIDILANSTED